MIVQMIAHGIQYVGKPICRGGWRIAREIQHGVAHLARLITSTRWFQTARHAIQTVFKASDRRFGLLSGARRAVNPCHRRARARLYGP